MKLGIGRYQRYRKHRNSKIQYYLSGCFKYVIPNFLNRWRKQHILNQFHTLDTATQLQIKDRVAYYNKLQETFFFSEKQVNDNPEPITLSRIKPGAMINGRHANSAYLLDTHEYTRYFNPRNKAAFLFGDITHVPGIPAFVKSRPIGNHNACSVILPLDRIRHFTFVKDNRDFNSKKDKLIGRAYITQPHRRKFWEMYFNHPLCDLGTINTGETGHPEWIVPPLPIEDHLDYKFILCLEGNDVASNLKWVMSSNSLAVMPSPRYETWFMEGQLIPNVHYVEIKPDYSDLEERLNYYIGHSRQAMEIIQNAHAYVSRFRNPSIEKITGLMVVEKYLSLVSQ